MEQKIYDVLIVGAGPNGSAAAITLAKQGHSVLLIDQFSFPREKICGDGLTGNSVRMLEQLGVWNEISASGNTMSKVEIFYKKDRSFALNIFVCTFRREKLDKILLDHAQSSGAEFKALKFTGKIENKDGHSVFETKNSEAETVQVSAKIALLSTGCQHTRALKNVKNISLKKPDLFAIRGYYQADWNVGHIQIFPIGKTNSDGYLWLFPMGNNEYNIGCGATENYDINFKKVLNDFVEKYSKEKNVVGKWTSPVKGAFLRTSLSNLKYAHFDNVIISGDALGTVFPLTGEGIGPALETGVIAAESIDHALKNNDLSLLKEYKKRIKKELKVKHFFYSVIYRIFKFKFFDKIFKIEFVNRNFSKFLIRCIRLSNRISKSLKKKKKN